MFRYECAIFRENRMPVLKNTCLWKVVMYKILRSVAASLLKLIRYKRENWTSD